MAGPEKERRIGLYFPLGLTLFMLNDSMLKLFLDYWNMPAWQKPLFVAVDAVLLLVAMGLIHHVVSRSPDPRLPSKSPEPDALPASAVRAETLEPVEEPCLGRA